MNKFLNFPERNNSNWLILVEGCNQIILKNIVDILKKKLNYENIIILNIYSNAETLNDYSILGIKHFDISIFAIITLDNLKLYNKNLNLYWVFDRLE